jgi:hypothetical protein
VTVRPIRAIDSRQVHLRHGVDHKPRQMIGRQPVAHVRRQQESLLTTNFDEVLCHTGILLTGADGTVYATPSMQWGTLPLGARLPAPCDSIRTQTPQHSRDERLTGLVQCSCSRRAAIEARSPAGRSGRLGLTPFVPVLDGETLRRARLSARVDPYPLGPQPVVHAACVGWDPRPGRREFFGYVAA